MYFFWGYEFPVVSLGKHMADVAHSSGRADPALTALEAALDVLSPSTKETLVLTGLHVQFVKLCVQAKQYRRCEPVLNRCVVWYVVYINGIDHCWLFFFV
jgi:hypothetical protein